MSELRDPTFPELWQSLQLDGVQVDPAHTVTPSSLRRSDPEETLIRGAHASKDPMEALVRLPVLPIDDDEAGEADLVLRSLLGQGGMGTVHLAAQRSLGRDVAVKRLTRVEPVTIQGLLREAVVTGSLEHPNIVPVHALGRSDDGEPVLVMKRVEGRRWSQLVRRDRPFDDESLERHLQVLLDVCNALSYAHSRGVVHRDVKLANVMVGEFGEVYLLDWGVAAPIGSRYPGQLSGTPGYMAPEMVGGQTVTERTDVYLLGSTLHHMLTGRARHRGHDLRAVLEAAWASDPYAYPPDIPEELADICNRATARDPVRRFESALAFQRAIHDHLRHRSSLHVATRSAARIAEVEALIAGHNDARVVDDAFAVCRHGLREALAAWPENPRAQRDLARCLETMIPFRLGQGDAPGAHDLLEELREWADPDPDLAERVEHDLRKHRALTRLGRELDMSATGRQRMRFLLVMWVVATLFGGAMVGVVEVGWVPVTHFSGIWVAIAAVVALQVGLLATARRMFTNVVDQRFMYTVLAAAWAVLLNRIAGWILDGDPTHVYVQDLLLLTLATAVAGFSIKRRVLYVSGLFGFGTLMAAMFPQLAVPIIAGALSAAIALLAFLFREWSE